MSISCLISWNPKKISQQKFFNGKIVIFLVLERTVKFTILNCEVYWTYFSVMTSFVVTFYMFCVDCIKIITIVWIFLHLSFKNFIYVAFWYWYILLSTLNFNVLWLLFERCVFVILFFHGFPLKVDILFLVSVCFPDIFTFSFLLNRIMIIVQWYTTVACMYLWPSWHIFFCLICTVLQWLSLTTMGHICCFSFLCYMCYEKIEPEAFWFLFFYNL